jgi:hypothetical protein
MTQDRRFDRAKPNRPPDRGGYGRAQRCSEPPQEGPAAQIQGVLTVYRHGLRGALPLTAARAVSKADLQSGRGHSTPIGTAPGATV